MFVFKIIDRDCEAVSLELILARVATSEVYYIMRRDQYLSIQEYLSG